MGGIDFRIKAKGRNVKEAYQRAVDAALEEHGSDAYNGTISTCSRITDVTEAFKRSGYKSIDEYISAKLNKMENRTCEAICIKEPVISNLKVKSQVQNLVTPGKKEWVLQYEVISIGDRYVGKAEMKTDAIKIAREFTEKHQVGTKIIVIRELKGSDNVVAKIHYKKDKKEAPGEWILFGIAAS